MVEANERTAVGVERLRRLERMMTDAYDTALDKVNDPKLVEMLAPFRMHHQESSQALQGLADRAEGTAPELDASFRRYVDEVLETLRDAARRDESLGELRIAEAALGMEYGQVLSDAPDEVTAGTVKECMRHEAEHVRVLAMAHQTTRT